MKSRDYMSDTWCLLVGMSRNHVEPLPDSSDNQGIVESKREPHVLARLLVGLLTAISQLI